MHLSECCRLLLLGDDQQDHLSLAMESLEQLQELTDAYAEERVLYNLNRWVEDQKPSPDWRPTDMLKRLSTRYRARGRGPCYAVR